MILQGNNYFHLVLALIACLLIAIIWQLVPHPAVAVAVCLVPLAFLVTIRLAFTMVLLFVIFSFFRIHEVFPLLYNFKIPLLLSAASLTALIWHTGISRNIKIYWRPELSALSLFFLLVIAGVTLASNVPVALSYFKSIYWKIAIMTFAIAWLMRTEKDFALASRLITFSGILVGWVALYNKANSIGLVEGTRVTIGRDIGSVLGDPNDLALVLMFPVSFALSLATTRNIDLATKLLGICGVSILTFAIIATQSRGGLLGILAIFAVFGYRRIQSKTLFVGLGAIAAVVLFLVAGIADRASGGAAEAGIDASAMGRLYAWEAALGMALHNPLSGVGLNNFYYNYYFYSPHWDGLNHAVHSTWFGVLAETGFLGLLVFLWIVLILVRTAIRTLNRIETQSDHVNPAIHATALAVFGGLLGTIISGTFLTQGFTWPIYILAAIIVAVAHWVDTNLPAVNTTHRVNALTTRETTSNSVSKGTCNVE